MWRPPLGQQQLREDMHKQMVPASRAAVKGGHRAGWVVSAGLGSVRAVKKLLLFVLIVVIGIELYRCRTTPGELGRHQRGTPDHWPPIIRKPPPALAPTASQQKAPSPESR